MEVLRLIKDVKNILADRDPCTLFALNEKLAQLGWAGGTLDQFSFELILVLLEDEQAQPVTKYDYSGVAIPLEPATKGTKEVHP